MKNILIIICLIIGLISCKKKQNSFIVDANVSGLKDGTKLFLFNTNTYKILDSTIAFNNKFSFKGRLKDPFRVDVFDNNGFNISFWLEEKIKITATKEQLLKDTGELSRYVSGGKIQNIAIRYNELLVPIDNRTSVAYKKLNDKLISKEEYNKVQDSATNISFNFFLKNPNNYFTISKVLNYRFTLKKEQLENYFGLLSKEIKQSSYGRFLDDFLHLKQIEEGECFFDIIGKNLNGEEVKLSDFKGKVILLDFWAGWCPPCKKQMKDELPLLKEKYRDKNFQIVSYSFDINKKMWKSASDKLEISWPDYSNLTKLNISPVALRYGISSIPISFIISEDGIVLKRVEYDDDLEDELDKILLYK